MKQPIVVTAHTPPTELTLALLGTIDAWREHHPDVTVQEVLDSLADVKMTTGALLARS